jgi:hypothetical protein
MPAEAVFVMPPVRFCLACTGRLSIYHSEEDYLCYRLSCHDRYECMQKQAQAQLRMEGQPVPIPNTKWGHVICAVSKRFGIAACELCGSSNELKYTRPRQVAYYLLKHDAELKYAAIGRLIGKRGRSQVYLYYHRLVDSFSDFAEDIAQTRDLYPLF